MGETVRITDPTQARQFLRAKGHAHLVKAFDNYVQDVDLSRHQRQHFAWGATASRTLAYRIL